MKTLRNRGLLFIFLVVLESGLAMAYGQHVPYGDARVDRASHEYLAHPTPENKAVLDAQLERLYAPGRKRNRVIMGLLIANSGFTAAVGYGLLKAK